MNIFIIFLCVLFYFIFYNTYFSSIFFIKKYNQSSVEFMTKLQLQQFFKDDPDGYSHSFNQINLHAYGYNTVNDMINDIVKVADDFTEEEKQILIKECNRVDSFLSTFTDIPHFPGKKVSEIQWKLAKTNGKVYEKGYPHTRMNIIFLPSHILHRDILGQVLAHEKVHVFSRLFPEDMKKWNTNNGYILYRKMSDYPNARINPDLDGNVYLDSNQNETVALYPNDYPTSMEEAIYPQGKIHLEHPNEELAYKVDKYFSKNN
jgi:hypothetical protein